MEGPQTDMRYLLSTIFCLWASCAWAFPPGFIGAVTQGSTAGGEDNQTYDFLEGFEADPGYDNTWTESGTPDEDYTVSPIVGAQSLLLDPKTNLADQATMTNYSQITAGNTVNVKFRMFCPYVPTTGAEVKPLLRFTSTSPSDRAVLSFKYSNGAKLNILALGGTGAAAASAISANTSYYVWVTYKKGTGSNAVATVAFNTTHTRPTSGDNYAESTNGTTTADAQRIYLGGDNYSSGDGANGSYTCVFDQVMTWEN